MGKKQKQLEDYEVCPSCGHIGILHGYSKGCKALTSLGNYLGTQCGCKVKRNSKIPPKAGGA